MLKKMLSPFKIIQPFVQSAAEAEAADSISTPEKTAALLVRLEASIEAFAGTPNGSRLLMLRSQHAQAMLASRRHHIEGERLRVTAATQRDKANGEKSLENAKQAFASAERVYLEKQSLHLAVLARLEPLESQLTLAIQGTAEQLSAAQAAFDAAVLKGDEPAEMKAAEQLYELKAGTRNPAGPLQLRLAAIHREEIAAHKAMAAAEQEKNEANEAILCAQADLALVEYDRQAQALLDAYVAQAIATRKCSTRNGPHARKLFSSPEIGAFSAEISSTERLMLSHRKDGTGSRRLPDFVVRDMIISMSTEPNLAILGTNVEDIAEPLPESPDGPLTAPIPGGMVARADGAFEDYFPPSDDLVQAHAA